MSLGSPSVLLKDISYATNYIENFSAAFRKFLRNLFLSQFSWKSFGNWFRYSSKNTVLLWIPFTTNYFKNYFDNYNNENVFEFPKELYQTFPQERPKKFNTRLPKEFPKIHRKIVEGVPNKTACEISEQMGDRLSSCHRSCLQKFWKKLKSKYYQRFSEMKTVGIKKKSEKFPKGLTA